MALFQGFLIGLIVGIVLMRLRFMLISVKGELRIDHSNKERDVYRFEIDELDSLTSKKIIILKIDNQATFTHE